jgi:antitoxin (DNA-binding transcriptional repressor) of toxin-antitoxin stability system
MDQEASSADRPDGSAPSRVSRPAPAAGSSMRADPYGRTSRRTAWARSQLLRLVDVSAAGEEVVIQRSGRPVARLVPVERRRPVAEVFGALHGESEFTADFDELPREVAAQFRWAFCWASPRLVAVPRDARLPVPGLGGRGVRSARRVRFAPKPQRADQPPATGSVSGRRRGLRGPRGSRRPPESSRSS